MTPSPPSSSSASASSASDELRTPGGLVVPAAALDWSFARSGGPGGQHVNTTSSKVTLTIAVATVTGRAAALERVQTALGDTLRVTSQTHRSQWRNRQDCLARAGALLDDAARPPDPERRSTRPTRGAVERRLDAKRRESHKKQGRRGGGRDDW
jgi:ribosome-associated protein